MQYYFLRETTNKKITGITGPQCMVFPSGYSLSWYDSPDSLTRLTNSNFPSKTTQFIFELDPKAKVTDFISQAIIPARGFLINEKVKVIFDNFKLPEHKYFPAIVIANKVMLRYLWLHFISNDYSQINYEKSVFYEGDATGWKQNDFYLEGSEQLLKLQESNIIPTIWLQKLVPNNSFIRENFGIFLFPLLHQDVFISEEIISSLQMNGITGFDFVNQNILT